MKDRFGLDRESHDYIVALAGNPNTGKSTVFNALTGLRQHTGNWPGKTVARAEGTLRYEGKRYKLIDLPGTYSLISQGQDEQIARDFVLFGEPDCIVIVLDATNVERNLALTLQILEVTGRAVVALNLIDEAKRRGITVDPEALSKELGVPVVATVARDKVGMVELAEAVAEVCARRDVAPVRNPKLDPALETAVDELVAMLPNIPNAKWVALRLLEGDETVRESLVSGFLENQASVAVGAGEPSEVTA